MHVPNEPKCDPAVPPETYRFILPTKDVFNLCQQSLKMIQLQYETDCDLELLLFKTDIDVQIHFA